MRTRPAVERLAPLPSKAMTRRPACRPRHTAHLTVEFDPGGDADRRGDLLIDIAAILLIVSAVAAIGGVVLLLLITL